MAAKHYNSNNSKSNKNDNDSSNNNNQENGVVDENTSRVCVKNVPPSCNESNLKSHLTSSDGSAVITDCKILRTKDGKSRKLAFVGFKTPEMAQQIVSYFHKTYYGTSRLVVELAFSKGSNEKVGYRPWSKYSAGSSRHDQIHDIHDKKEKDMGDDDVDDNNGDKDARKLSAIDKKKEEFLQVMMGSKKGTSGKMWGNDDGLVDDNGNNSDDREKSKTGNGKKRGGNDIDIDTYESDSDSSSDSSSCASSSDSSSDGGGEGEGDEKKDKKEDIQKHQKSSIPPQNDSSDDSSSSSQPMEEFSSDRLFVRNLPFHITEEEVKEVFVSYGVITECHIPVDDSNRNKGYAFIKYALSKDAVHAREKMDGSSLQGRLIHVLPARPERDNKDEFGGGGDREDITHKKKMEMARQKGASNTTASWSTNFVRGDAVVDNLADRFQLDKGEVFNIKDDLSSGNAAVRLALGETKVLEENREFFQKHGIQMDALRSSSNVKDSAKRSTTLILVKNLPYDTTHDELSKMFLVFDGDANILLPPSRTIALVDFKSQSNAKKAFRKLAYKRFKHVPLYLEWAPLGMKVQLESSGNQTDRLQGSAVAPKIQDDDEEDDGNNSAEQKVTSIYIKNLNFSTSEDDLKSTFEKVIGKSVRSVRIPVKLAPVKSKNKNKLKDDAKMLHLSMGYGFVECSSEESARKAIKSLQGTFVNGHAMELKVSSTSSNSTTKETVSKKKSTKLMVRNVPFQASRTDILQLFGSFGQLKTVRLPKKFDGGHRGFAFVEFTAAKEAEKAMASLSQTHLYGRHLVLEWAEGMEDIENIRSKAKKHSIIISENIGKNKKIRFN